MDNGVRHRARIQIIPLVLTLAAALAVVKLFGGATQLPRLSTMSASASPFFSVAQPAGPSQSATATAEPVVITQPDAGSERGVAEQPPTEQIYNSAEEGRILERLRARRLRLVQREETLATREALLRTTQTQIETALADLEARETALAAREAQVAEEAAEDVANIVKAYERMKPRDAARIFDLLENQLLVSVAHQMRSQALASILAEMSPERARELTTLLSERRSLGSVQGLGEL
ncbi:MAG: hypothetical protein AAFW83_09155 [Pseudomonadota bacterium]